MLFKHVVSTHPLLLLLDEHSSHFCLLPHMTHITQSLDVSVLKPLKVNWHHKKVECLVVKGVSDLGDKNKDDNWQPQAATNAVKYLCKSMKHAKHLFMG